jgi:histone H3
MKRGTTNESFCIHLCALSTDTTSELNVLGHDGNTLGVDGTQVGVLEKSNKVGLGSLLKSKNGSRLETKIRLEVLGNLAHKTLEWSLTDKEICALLVFTDLTKSHGPGTVTVRLLNSSCSGCGLTSGLS